MAAKRTSESDPALPSAGADGRPGRPDARRCPARVSREATVPTIGRTGVEMEALTAVSVALLTVYDMAKAIDREMVISDISLA